MIPPIAPGVHGAFRPVGQTNMLATDEAAVPRARHPESTGQRLPSLPRVEPLAPVLQDTTRHDRGGSPAILRQVGQESSTEPKLERRSHFPTRMLNQIST